MRYILGILSLCLLASCGGNKASDESVAQSLDSAANAGSNIDTEMINMVLQQIPSPLEISVLLRESGNDYSPELLNDPSNTARYNTTFQKALNLGIYGTDLGYTNIYGQNQDGIEYISTIKSLADELNIGQFFDLSTIKRLATNSSNLDSLLLITTQNFNDINEYLQTQNRSNLSTLFLLGGWLEAMNITTQIAISSEGNEELTQAIGDQQIVAEKLAELLSLYESEPTMDNIRGTMQPLWDSFSNVQVDVTEGESSSEVVDGVLVISDSSESTVNISRENLEEIARLVSQIRNELVM